MSDQIKHECGIALVRLKKPLSYYVEKYGSPLYAIHKLYLLMEKQHNRGQDGAGVANININATPGTKYIFRKRSDKSNAIEEIFEKLTSPFAQLKKENLNNISWLQANMPYTGELWLGHLRYATHGNSGIEYCHPKIRQNNWRSRSLVVAGNFNLTNVDKLFDVLLKLGQHPKEKTDTATVLEKIGHFLDEENQLLFNRLKNHYSNEEISERIAHTLDLKNILTRACRDFDGGYVIAGMVGQGTSFVVRDPAGIRPVYFYEDEEVVVVASEKPAIKTAFNIDYQEIKEVNPGYALIIDREANVSHVQIREAQERKACSFERIYFSRSSDPDIYKERKTLGKLLLPQVLKAINYDLKNTVFSYIPNTAETAFLGMLSGLEEYLIQQRKEVLIDGKPHIDSIEDILAFRPRVEKLVIKDAKLRTFITNDAHRDELVAHVYDTTYEVIKKERDTLVVIDDSIVRGTTLEKSILKMLDRLGPRKIVIVSSAPQIRFPDCYGIDMSKMKEFAAFRAVLALIKEKDMEDLLEEIYSKCVQSQKQTNPINYVKALYKPFTNEEIDKKISEIITPHQFQADLTVVYQTVENLHQACPNHLGDWYFTGNYPTPGGNRVVNKAFMNFVEGKSVRAY